MQTYHVVAAIIKSGDAVFATQRGYGEQKGGWEFPGGKVEPGETEREALVREIREELAVDVEVGRFFMNTSYDYPTFHLDMDCYLCTIAQGTPQLLEHEAARWLAPDELDAVDWLPADITLIEALKKQRLT